MFRTFKREKKKNGNRMIGESSSNVQFQKKKNGNANCNQKQQQIWHNVQMCIQFLP